MRIDVFLRSLGTPAAGRHAEPSVLARLADLETSGRVDTYTVSIWGDSVCPDDPCAETPVGQYVMEKVEAFRAWAEESGLVELPFETRTVHPMLEDEPCEVLRLPRICLAVVADGELIGVFPGRFGDRHLSVHEYLDLLGALPREMEPVEERSAGTALPRGSP